MPLYGWPDQGMLRKKQLLKGVGTETKESFLGNDKSFSWMEGGRRHRLESTSPWYSVPEGKRGREVERPRGWTTSTHWGLVLLPSYPKDFGFYLSALGSHWRDF